MRSNCYEHSFLQYTVLFVGLFIFALPGFVNAQYVINWRDKGEGTIHQQYVREGLTTFLLGNDHTITKQGRYDPGAEADVIIQFNRPSLSKREYQLKRKGKRQQFNPDRLRNELQLLHDQFRKDLADITDTKAQGKRRHQAKARMGSGTRITHKFLGVYAGASVHTRNWVIEQLENLSYIKNIYKDREVHTVVDRASEMVDADKLHSNTSASGQGVDVAILDTGIDYEHPALGGGIGTGFKVKGGYDIINDDSDPMDDHGHGTHVAGIVAASDTLHTGLAPEASLYAYKVLNEQGVGKVSDVIAGIERAVKDKVDIINLSLGGPPINDDPLIKATNNAVRSGVLCVAAAGNFGPSFRSIATPGAASLALTVGASNFSDSLTSFSSRGPTPSSFAVKPDILAPGVDIASTRKGGGYTRFSGTSMSTPVVSGAAALLHALTPDYEPLFRKAAMMQSAKDLPFTGIWEEGHGRLDLDDAARSRVAAVPGNLSYGLVDLGENTWTVSDTLEFFNRDTMDHSYQLTNNNIKDWSGVSIDISPTEFTVPAGGKSRVLVTAHVDNEQASFPSNRARGFSGFIHAVSESDSDTISVPWGIVRAPYVLVNVNYDGPLLLYVHPSSSKQDATPTGFQVDQAEDQYRLIFPVTGNYNFIGRLGSGLSGNKQYFVFREQVKVPETLNISLGRDEANHSMILAPRDQLGNRLDLNRLGYGMNLVLHKDGYGFFSFQSLNDTTYFSNMSDEYEIMGMGTANTFDQGISRDYRFPYFLQSIDDDRVISNNPAELRPVTYYASGIKSVRRAFFSPTTHFKFNGYAFSFYPLTRMLSEQEVDMPVQQQLYVLPEPEPDTAFNLFSSYRVMDYSNVSLGNPVQDEDSINTRAFHQTGIPVIASEDSTGFVRLADFGNPHIFHDKNIPVIGIGRQLSFFNSIISKQGIHSKWRGGWFQNTFGGTAVHPIRFNLYRDSTVIKRDGFLNSGLFSQPVSFEDISIQKGDRIEIKAQDLKVADTTGNARLTYIFGDQDIISQIRDIKLDGNERPTESLHKEELNKLHLSLKTKLMQELPSYVYLRKAEAGTTWTPVDTLSGDSWTMSVPGEKLGNAYYDMKIVVDPIGKNRLEYQLTPAFRFSRENRLPPEAPDKLMAEYSSGSVRLTWSPNLGADIALYKIYRGRGETTPELLTSVRGDRSTYLDTTVHGSTTYTYKLAAVGIDSAKSDFSSSVEVEVTKTGVTDDEEDKPRTFSLKSNYPNPFNPVTNITYTLPKTVPVKLEVYNILGRKVRTLVDQSQPAGKYSVQFKANNLPSGIYLYQLKAGSFKRVRKMTLVK